MEDPAARSFDPSMLGEAMARRLYRRAVVTAQITVPAVPSMIDEYVTMCANVFAVAGVQYTAEQSAQLKTVLAAELAKAYTASSAFEHRDLVPRSVRHRDELPRRNRIRDDRGRLRRLGGHPRGAAVRHRAGRPGVGAGRRGRRSRHPPGARRRRRNRAQRTGSGATRPPGGRGGDEPEVRRHHSCGGPTRISRGARDERRRLRDYGRCSP